jgi:hypothetical protein
MKPRILILGGGSGGLVSANKLGDQHFMLKILISLIMFIFIYGCALNKEIYTPDININKKGSSFIKKKGSSVIKVHMKDGSLYILNSWKVDKNKRILKGNGTYYSIDRTSSNVNNFEIPIDSIAIIESNEVVPSKALELLVLIMRVSFEIFISLSEIDIGSCNINFKYCLSF